MLIGVVQFVQQPKGGEFTSIPSLVRLGILDACYEARTQIREPFAIESIISSHLGPLGTRSAEIDRESSVIRLAEAEISASSTDDGKLTDELVKRRAKVVGNLPDPRGPIDGRFDLFFWAEWMQNMHPNLRVELSDAGGTHVTIVEDLGIPIERAELVVSLGNLISRPVEWMHEVNSEYERQPVGSAQTENAEGRGDTDPKARGLHPEPEEGRVEGVALNS